MKAYCMLDNGNVLIVNDDDTRITLITVGD